MEIVEIKCDGCGMMRKWRGYECLTYCDCLADKPEDESNLLDAQVIKLLADRHINLVELKHLVNKVKRVKIKDDPGQILIKDLGESYGRVEDKNFINKYAGKTINIYEWCGDWWILEDDNYVITENCFTKI